MAKSILYDKGWLIESEVDKIIKTMRKHYNKVRKVDKIVENGKKYYRIRIYKN